MSNPTLQRIEASIIAEGKADLDFRRFKAYDPNTGKQLFELKREVENKWWWRNGDQRNQKWTECPLSIELEALYIASLNRGIVE